MRFFRKWGGILQERWPVVPFTLGCVGVVLGWRGYHLYTPHGTELDNLYAALKLMVLDGPISQSGVPNPLPWELSVARLLCAAVPGSTVIFLTVRSFTNHADILTSVRARNHLVVIGATTESCQLAIAAASTRRGHGKDRRRVVLVGLLEPARANYLRAQGVVVAPYSRSTLLERLLRGASEVVIMEEVDVVGLRRFREVRSLVSKEPGSKPLVRLVLNSTELAQMQRSKEDFRVDRGATAISSAEAVAEKVTSQEYFPALKDGRSDHIVVLGKGEYALQVSLLSFQHRYVPGRSIKFDLIEASGDSWTHEVKELLPESFVADSNAEHELETHHPSSLGSKTLVHLISSLCSAQNQQHQIFLVGIEDEKSIPIGNDLAWQLPRSTIVALLQEDFGGTEEFEERAGSKGKLHVVRVGEVLAEIDALRLTVVERLAIQLCEEFERFGSIPGKLAHSQIVQEFTKLTTIRRREWSEELARVLLSTLKDYGVELQQNSESAIEVIGGPALIAMRSQLQTECNRLRQGEYSDHLPNSVLRLAAHLPRLLGRVGIYLCDTSGRATTFSKDEIERMAIEVHSTYQSSVAAAKIDSASLPHFVDWSEMNEEQREKNRRPARDIESRLLNIGYFPAPLSSIHCEPLVLEDSTIDMLAEDEHEAWILTQLIHGYRFGGIREEDLRLHPQMVAYGNLPDIEKYKDKESVRQTPVLLASIGWGVTRQGKESRSS